MTFSQKLLESPKITLQPYKVEGESMDLTFHSISDRDSFKNTLDLSCTMARMVEEMNWVNREKEAEEDKRVATQKRIKEREETLNKLRYQKDRTVDEFKALLKEQKELSRVGSKKDTSRLKRN
eukprot:CAMPEP_0201540238 /NCGR_PEP_ID=MMETSP0161_2-20130828/70836_1 /ASSEMBLY_ACC=CAM_ASM_000251 /TAXON_ID=180227 /ORGANISM="Neoparamoeba aestuarina, Strain SoJaBio B1-5/56/2" /LENGTH=122 /DNA_ID=CAMNT_0047947691 /DNA_START=1667 /DNA_END=2035 /DNA_ORIENTATION=+